MRHLIIIIVLLALIYGYFQTKETFINNLSIVDPEPLYLHKDISEKENWWNIIHTKLSIYF